MIKKHPIISAMLALLLFFSMGYIVLLVILFRPSNMIKGRMNSNSKDWVEIAPLLKTLKPGIHKDSVFKLVGKPDLNFDTDSTVVWSYQQYGVIAPDTIVHICFKMDTINKIDIFRF